MRAVFLFVLVLALAAYYFWPKAAQAPPDRGASSMTEKEIEQARAGFQQPWYGSFDRALGSLVFDGLVVAGDADHVARMSRAAREALATQIAADAQLALALATTEDEFAALEDFGARVARVELGFGAQDAAATAGLSAEMSAQARVEKVREQKAAGEISGAEAAAVVLAGFEQHRSDLQNVHDAAVTDSTKASALWLVETHGVPSERACDEAVAWADEAIDAAFADDAPRAGTARGALQRLDGRSSLEGLSLRQVLALVHARARAPENEDTARMIAENAAKAIADSAGTCPTGRTVAVLGALAINDASFVPAEREEQIRNDALAAAREAGLAKAAEISAGDGPLASAAANFVDPRSAPDPDQRDADALAEVLSGYAVAAAEDIAKKFSMRQEALGRLRKDVRAAFQ